METNNSTAFPSALNRSCGDGMMMSVRKRFSKSLFEDNDELARATVEKLKHHFGLDEFRDSKKLNIIGNKD